MDYQDDKLISGWLKKKSPNLLGSWQKRFWVVMDKGTKLAYFDQEKRKGKIKGFIDIKQIQSLQKNEDLRFTIYTPDREWELQAPTSQQRDKWIKQLWSLKNTIVKSQRSKSTVSPEISPRTRKNKTAIITNSDGLILQRLASQKQAMTRLGKLSHSQDRDEQYLTVCGANEVLKKFQKHFIENRIIYGELNKKQPNKKYVPTFVLLLSSKSLYPEKYFDDQLLDQSRLPPWLKLDTLFQIQLTQSQGKSQGAMLKALSVEKSESKTEKGFKLCVSFGEVVLQYLCQSQIGRDQWINALRNSIKNAKQLNNNARAERQRNIDGLVSVLSSNKAEGLQAKLILQLDQLQPSKLNFNTLIKLVKDQLIWLQSIIVGCLSKQPKRVDIAKLTLQTQRPRLVQKVKKFWDSAYQQLQNIEILRLSAELFNHHDKFKNIIHDQRLEVTIKLLVQIYFTNTLQKLTDIVSSIVDNQRIHSPKIKDELLVSNTPVDLFKIIYQPIQSARAFCGDESVVQKSAVFARRLIQKFFIQTQQLIDQVSLDDQKLVAICNNTLQFIKLNKNFESVYLRNHMEPQKLEKAFDLQNINKWFIQISNSAKLQLYLSCFGNVSELFQKKNFMTVDLRTIMQRLQQKVEVLGHLHQSFRRKLFRELLDQIVIFYFNCFTRSVPKEGKSQLNSILTKLKSDSIYLSDNFRDILFESVVTKALKSFQALTIFLTSKEAMQVQRQSSVLCQAFGKLFSPKVIRSLIQLKGMNKIDQQSLISTCSDIFVRANANPTRTSVVYNSLPKQLSQSQDDEEESIRKRRKSIHNSLVESKRRMSIKLDQVQGEGKKMRIQQGYLQKKKKGKSFYQRRYFKLTPDFLYWYSDQNSLQAQNKIQLAKVIQVKQVDSYLFSISVMTAKGIVNYQLKAHNSQQRQLWEESIRKTIQIQGEQQKIQVTKLSGNQPYLKDYFELHRKQLRKKLRAQAAKKRNDKIQSSKVDKQVRKATIIEKLQTRDKVAQSPLRRGTMNLTTKEKVDQAKNNFISVEIQQKKSSKESGCCEKLMKALGFY